MPRRIQWMLSKPNLYHSCLPTDGFGVSWPSQSWIFTTIFSLVFIIACRLLDRTFPESGHRKTWNLGPILRLHYASLSHLGRQCSPNLSDARVLLLVFAILSVCFYTPTLGHWLWMSAFSPSWNCSKPTATTVYIRSSPKLADSQCTNYSRMRVQWLTCTCTSITTLRVMLSTDELCTRLGWASWLTLASRCLVLREVKGISVGYYVVGEGAVTTGEVVNCVTSTVGRRLGYYHLQVVAEPQ